MENKKTFPLQIFPKKIREIIETTHKESNFPSSYIAGALFFAVAVAIGNCRTLIFNTSWKVKSILFMALVGSPGAGKTHPIRFAVAPFLKLDCENIKKYNQKLEEWKAATPESRGQKPVAKQLGLQDYTMEAICKILDHAKHGIFVFMDELKAWISSCNRYRNGGGDLEQWLSFYSGVGITVNRKTQDYITNVVNPYVSVIGGIQPNVLTKTFRGDNIDNGLLYRILFVHNSSEGEPILWKDDDLPSECDQEWEDFVRKILDSGGFFNDEIIEREYRMSPDAKTVVTEWHNRIEEDNANEGDESTVAIFKKIQDYCLRFCLVIHAMREAAGEIQESTTIDENTAMMATLLADYFYETAKEAYEQVINGGFEGERFNRFYNAMNDYFTFDQAVAVGEMRGFSRSTVWRYLNGETGKHFFTHLKHGEYQKKF